MVVNCEGGMWSALQKSFWLFLASVLVVFALSSLVGCAMLGWTGFIVGALGSLMYFCGFMIGVDLTSDRIDGPSIM